MKTIVLWVRLVVSNDDDRISDDAVLETVEDLIAGPMLQDALKEHARDNDYATEDFGSPIQIEQTDCGLTAEAVAENPL